MITLYLSIGDVQCHGDLVSPESGEVVGVVELLLQVLQLLARERGALLARTLLQLLILGVSSAQAHLALCAESKTHQT